MDERLEQVVIGVGGYRARLKVDESGVELVDIGKRGRVRWSEMARITVPEEATTISESTLIEFIPADPNRAPLRVRVTPSTVQGALRTQFVTAVNEYSALFEVPSSLTEEKIAGRPSSPRVAGEAPRKAPAIKGALGDYVAQVAAAQPDPPRSFDRGEVIRISVRETLPGPLMTLDIVGTFWVFWMLIAGSSSDYEVLSVEGLAFMILAALGGTLLAASVIQLKHARATRALTGGVLVVDEGSEDDPPGTRLVHPASGRLLVRLPAREAEGR